MTLAVELPAKPIVPAFASITEALSPLADPMLRVTADLLQVPHGAQKLFGMFGGYGVEATGQCFATKLGLPASLALLAGPEPCRGARFRHEDLTTTTRALGMADGCRKSRGGDTPHG